MKPRLTCGQKGTTHKAELIVCFTNPQCCLWPVARHSGRIATQRQSTGPQRMCARSARPSPGALRACALQTGRFSDAARCENEGSPCARKQRAAAGSAQMKTAGSSGIISVGGMDVSCCEAFRRAFRPDMPLVPAGESVGRSGAPDPVELDRNKRRSCVSHAAIHT